MMDQRLSSGPRMPDSLNGEGALRKALDGPIDDGRARKTSNTGDDGNTSSSQSLAIEGCNQVLLSLIEVRNQQGVLPLKFFGFAHSRIIPSPPSFVTLNFLRALNQSLDFIPSALRNGLHDTPWSRRTVCQTFFQSMECQSGARSGAAPAGISAANISACLPESVGQGSLVTEHLREVSPLSR